MTGVQTCALPIFLEARSIFAAGGGDGNGFATEGVDDAGRDDAASTGGFAGLQNVGPVIEDQPVGEDVAVNRRIDGKSDDQTAIVLR